MNKIDQLFVRACKSSTPATRVYSVYRRFYAVKPEPALICVVLIQICDKYSPISLSKLIAALNPDNAWRLGIEDAKYCYHEKVMVVLMSQIRLSEMSKFPGLTIPRMFRDKEEI